jgi:hypothetical protein
MNSGKIAGINPYDGNGSIIYLSFIDNFWRSLECGGQGRSPRAARRRFLKRGVSR